MAQPALFPARERATARIELAILRTRAYFSVFGYTPTLFELHRYLDGETATIEQVRAACRRLGQNTSPANSSPLPGTPPGSASILLAPLGHPPDSLDGGRRYPGEQGHRPWRWRASASKMLALPGSGSDSARLRLYLVVLKHLPFVRMIGLTGSRAIQPEGMGDTDLMIVAAPGRVWLCRLGTVVVARFARCFGDRLCPNYVVSADSLSLRDMSIYDAHELAQLVPLHGRAAYQELWDRNPAIGDLLPNSSPFACPSDRLLPGAGLLKRAGEWTLAGRLGDRLERWERTRKIARLQALGVTSPEIALTTKQCKGHFDGHKARTLAAYERLLSQLGGG